MQHINLSSTSESSTASLSDLVRQSRFKQARHRQADPLGVECVAYFKKEIVKRHQKFGIVGQAWTTIVPESLQKCSELTSFYRGTLGVIVQGSSEMYMLKQAMLAGLESQLLTTCRSAGLKKITLKAGRVRG
jgi:hypothetical protein